MRGPKVSVSLITYNHEKFLAGCLDSIVSQSTNFEFEIVVSDDCSTDSTAKILTEYAARYPKLIKPIFRKPNLGARRNAISTIKACLGDYIALMEGDDYWVDNQKLQIQADYLDANPDCAFCFTNQFTFYESNPDKKVTLFNANNRPPEKCDVGFYLKTNFDIPNNTKMFRKEVQPDSFPEFFFESYSWDWMLHTLQAQKSKMGYVDRLTLAYRRHPDAIYIVHSDINILDNGIKSVTSFNKFLGEEYRPYFKSLWWEYHEMAFAQLNNLHFGNFLLYFWKYLQSEKRKKFPLRDELWRFKTALFGKPRLK